MNNLSPIDFLPNSDHHNNYHQHVGNIAFHYKNNHVKRLARQHLHNYRSQTALRRALHVLFA